MKPDLKRIEATLHQLETERSASYPEPAASRNHTYSFKISDAAQKRKAPKLPKFKFPSFSSNRNSDNLANAMKPLKKIQTDLAATDAELQQILEQIEELYLEGPIVDGWLEFEPQAPEYGDYRLCGLDAAGKMWSLPCPPEQLASVSIAIARYQKLRQLLERKRYLERRKSQLAETLVDDSSHLQSS